MIKGFEHFDICKDEIPLIKQLSTAGKKVLKTLLELNYAQCGSKTSLILAAFIKYEWFGNREIGDFLKLLKGYFRLDSRDQELFEQLLDVYIDLLPQGE